MTITLKELKFVATEEKGDVSALYAEPESAKALLILGHGAGTNMRHPFMQDLSNALNQTGIATFRFNYPYSEKGGGMDSEKVRLATVGAAVTVANNEVQGLPIFAGGHSMSGRMISMACAQGVMDQLKGIIFLPFHFIQVNQVSNVLNISSLLLHRCYFFQANAIKWPISNYCNQWWKDWSMQLYTS